MPLSRRSSERAGKRLGYGSGPAAGVRSLRRPGLDAGDAGHRPEPGTERRLGRGPGGGDRERAVRLGLLPALLADVRKRRARDSRGALRVRARAAQARPRRRRRHRPRDRRPARADGGLQAVLRGGDGRAVPGRASGAARAGDSGGVRLLGGRARPRLPPDRGHPQLLRHGRERAADGVREPRRDLRVGRGLQPRRAHRRAHPVRRLPAKRPGGGRGLRGPRSRGPVGAGGAPPGGPRAAPGGPCAPRGPLRGHAGRGVHDRGGPPLPAPDPRGEAPGPGGGPLRPRCGRRGAPEP